MTDVSFFIAPNLLDIKKKVTDNEMYLHKAHYRQTQITVFVVLTEIVKTDQREDR